MNARRAQEDPVEHGPLEPNLGVTFPGISDPPVGFGRISGNLHVAITDMTLRNRGHAHGLVRIMIEGMRRIPIEAAGRFDGDRHVCELMLQPLKMPDRHAELLSVLRVFDTHIDELPRAAEGVGRK